MKKLTLFVFITLGAVCFAFSMSEKPKKNQNKVHTQKSKLSGKSLGYFAASITSDESRDGQVEITATVVARKNMSSAEFQWKTPKSAKIISGEDSGQVSLARGDQKVFSIIVDKDTVVEGDQLFFFVFEMKNGERHGFSQSFVYSPNNTSKSQIKSKTQKTPKYFE